MTFFNTLISCGRNLFTRSYKTFTPTNLEYKQITGPVNADLFVNNFDNSCYIYKPGQTAHVNLTDSLDSSYRGVFFKRIEKGEGSFFSVLHEATPDEIAESNILAIGGLDFDTPKAVSAIIKTAKTLAANNSKPEKYKFEAVAIFPEVSREARYEAADEYSQNSFYYPPYIEDRVRKFLIPKFVDEEDNTILNIRSSISLFSFSIGGRESMMMENALWDIFYKEYGLSNSLAQNLMSNVTMISLGYAPGLEIFRPGGFNKVACFSVNDRGVLLPEDFYDSILTKESVLENKISIKAISKTHSDTFKRIITFGNRLVTANSSWDDYDHTKNAYLECIKHLPDNIQEGIGDCLSYSDLRNLGQTDEFFE